MRKQRRIGHGERGEARQHVRERGQQRAEDRVREEDDDEEVLADVERMTEED